MACEAAIKHTRAAFTHDEVLTSADVFARVRWWTPDTIEEAVRDLHAAGVLRYWGDGKYSLIGALR